jgi:hypothetical protein
MEFRSCSIGTQIYRVEDLLKDQTLLKKKEVAEFFEFMAI